MKRNRLIFLILWILSLVGISFFGGPVSYGFFALLTLLPLVSLVYLLFVFWFFRIYQELDGKHLVADQTVPFYFTLMNEYFFGFAGIRVRFFSSFSTISGLDDAVEYELLPQTGITKQTNLVCKYRGEYEVGIKTVEIQDYFQLIRIAYHNRETLRVIVKPNLVELQEFQSENLAQAMSRYTMSSDTELDVLVRKYEPGDDPRQINWSASARSGELLVRNRVGQEREGVGILMGTKRFGKEMQEYLPIENKMLELTLAVVLFFAKKNIDVHAYYVQNGLLEKNISGLKSFEEFYEGLSAVEFKEEAEETQLMALAASKQELFRCKSVFIVLHEMSAEALNLAHLLHENNVSTVIYLVQDELQEGIPETKETGVEVMKVRTDADLTEVAL
ncbi:MAG: DUF58 domain-containing protein [Lachnospiraceae bacterium]|nr:DUF58 domain-containing protein [Lachnospiraceae bacterium]